MKYISAFVFATILSTAMGFAPVQHKASSAAQVSFDPLNLSENKIADHLTKFGSMAAATLIASPLVALAGEFPIR